MYIFQLKVYKQYLNRWMIKGKIIVVLKNVLTYKKKIARCRAQNCVWKYMLYVSVLKNTCFIF